MTDLYEVSGGLWEPDPPRWNWEQIFMLFCLFISVLVYVTLALGH